MLTVGRPLRLGAAALAAWAGAAVCLWPASGVAQQPASYNTPAATAVGAGDPSSEHAPGARAWRHDPTGVPPANAPQGAPSRLGSGHIADSHHAEQEQHALHEAIKEKFKQFDAAMKKGAANRAAEQRRQEASRQIHTAAAASTAAAANSPAAAVAAANPPTTTAAIRNAAVSAVGHGTVAPGHVAQRPPATPHIPDPVRQAAVAEAPKFPHTAQPLPRALGGPALSDPKKSTLLAGSTVHRRL